MTYLNSIEDAIKILRKIISIQSEIDINDIINADSIRGPELTKIVNDQKVPYAPNENVIVFELRETQDFDLSMELNNDNMHDVSSHQLRLVIYGDNARTVARKLKSRMLTQNVIKILSENGLSLVNVSNIESTTEMINTTRYIRRDMQINFIVSMNIDEVDTTAAIELAETHVIRAPRISAQKEE